VLEVMERLRRHTTIFYSTHILADVQRVSDTVAILNRGRLVAQAPIEQLLDGNGAVTYTLALRGETRQAQTRLASQSWVTSIQKMPDNGHATWQVSVSDRAAAEADLLRVVQSEGDVAVLEFARKKLNLEEVFLALTEGGSNG